jgi:hypothetical protein
MKCRRVLAPLLLVVPVIAAGCGGDDVEKNRGAATTGTAQVGDKPAVERSDRSRQRGSPSGSRSRALEGGVARPHRKPAYRHLRDEVVGYSLRYPRGWKAARRPSGATAFAARARCRSVEIVDFAPPPGSGGSAVLHSFVQVCAKRLTDRSSIDEFMRQTYGGSLSKYFESAKFAGVRAYRSRMKDQDVIFLQTNDYRIQVYTAVVADRQKRARRQAQVNRVLRSFSLVQG